LSVVKVGLSVKLGFSVVKVGLYVVKVRLSVVKVGLCGPYLE